MTLKIILFLLPLFFLNAQNDEWQTISNVNNVKAITILNDIIWAASDGGAFSYNPQDATSKVFTNTEGLQTINLTTLTSDNENVYFGHLHGTLQSYNPAVDVWFKIDHDGLSISQVVIKGDSLWIATTNEGLPGKTIGLFKREDDNFVFQDFFVNFPQTINIINDIEIFNGSIWIATDNGILTAFTSSQALSDPSSWDVINTSNGLSSNTVLCLEIFENQLWIGTSQTLSRLNSSSQVFNDSPFNGNISQLSVTNENLIVGSGDRKSVV